MKELTTNYLNVPSAQIQVLREDRKKRSRLFISRKNRLNKYSVEQHISPFPAYVHMELVLDRT